MAVNDGCEPPNARVELQSRAAGAVRGFVSLDDSFGGCAMLGCDRSGELAADQDEQRCGREG